MLTAALLMLTAAAPQPANAPVPVLARAVERGDVLSSADFETARVAPAVARGALSPAEAAGQETTRRLSAGSPVRANDVAPPRMVRRGETVTIALISGALRITSPGRALADAGRGDPVRVLNLATNRTLEGVATSSGEVQIAAP
ncbi:flagellar basal body P-ring formation chaperone FlgA [Novosphingobium panipatense]|uniref:Flagella basal body P-ring formation protein FlgA n=1 Tax=Novosphingobium panipatense TaxID=428991 RepID=A0ABY1QNN3_9SPHN|nr:flagellar basal body P-ring formation chaperone FlgA [Novosphingobium panipatense]SMP76100.1 flagella basal body P-ring formation protein FlgA [Novosphingobium panipatense]